MRLKSAPGTILNVAGAPQFGMYAGAIPDVDLDRAVVAGFPGPLGRLRLKQWEHWLVVHPEIAVSLAIVDAAITKLVWVQVIDRKTGGRWEHRREGPHVRARTARSLYDEFARGGASGLFVDIHDHLDANEHVLTARGSSKGLPDVALDLVADSRPGIQPLAVVLPVGRGRAMYSHKVPLPLRGTIDVGACRYTLDPAECTAVLDVHKAHYPRDTWWNWATAVGFDARGRRIAFNVTANVVTDPALHENVVWVDGHARLVGAPGFAMASESWSVRTDDGAVDVVFDAQGEREEDLDYVVIKSKFRQRYGTFRGTIRVGGEQIELTEAFGLFEDHRARW